MPDPPRLIRSYLPESYKVNDLASYFAYFMRLEEFELIARNMNKYTKEYPTRYLEASQRPFKPTNAAEIMVYFALLIFIGIHRDHNPKSH
jgi:hypothetical protein